MSSRRSRRSRRRRQPCSQEVVRSTPRRKVTGPVPWGRPRVRRSRADVPLAQESAALAVAAVREEHVRAVPGPAGHPGDSPQLPIVLDKVRVPGPVGRPRTRPQAVAADRAYSSKANRTYLRRRHITAVIPEKIDQQANRRKKGPAGGRPVTYDAERCKQRNTVERCFQKIKTWRGLATRYDKAPVSYEAGLHLRGSVMRLKLLTATT
ncbi:transposase [Streptomyces chilikensis]|uniref:Transposase n=1 Tax=Streptomyces chilikensis TaxID=1194079 RepID=A0ABV3ELF2_9ACTN